MRDGELRERFHEELKTPTPRAMRAKRFADQVFALVRESVPDDLETQMQLLDRLSLEAFRSNAEIINVPPEFDHLMKARLEQKMLEKALAPFSQTPTGLLDKSENSN